MVGAHYAIIGSAGRIVNVMNIIRSVTGLAEVWKDDVAFRKIGRPYGWYIKTHYKARWRDRTGQKQPWEEISFLVEGRRQSYWITAEYLGALKGVLLDREYLCTSRLPTKPKRIMDLGGNIGFGSGYLATLFPSAQFAVVEPDPRNLEMLARNLKANGVRGRVFAAAAGPHEGLLNLRMGPNPSCSSLEISSLHQLKDKNAVKVTTIPILLREMGWDAIDLLKIDIEGAEEALLSQANDWLSLVGAIVLEIHPNTTAERIGSYLESYGFKLERASLGREPVYLATRL